MSRAASAAEGPDGVLVVDKAAGMTSHDVVSWARRRLATRRVGHTGTLDPLATGVLPLVVGRATRLASLLSGGDKVYAATIRLGVATDTYDITGTPAAPAVDPLPADIDRTAVDGALAGFVGPFAQTPPPYSAKKIRGVRAYALARAQRPEVPEPVEVTVRELTLVELALPDVRCRVTCSPGFYMRSLAHDLGVALGCGGCLAALRRERSGSFDLSHAMTLDEDPATSEGDDAPVRLAARLVPMESLRTDLPRVTLTEDGLRRARHGNAVGPGHLAGGWSPSGPGGPYRLFSPDERLVALADDRAGSLHPRIVLV